jgi:hypothetical protein
MKLDVPDEFVALFMKLDREISPHYIMNALKWASDNPDEAIRVAESWKKLGGNGKREFQTCLSVGYDPPLALKNAEEYEARQHGNFSLLGKAIANAKKGGYRFTLPNGVECIVKVKDGDYWFTFNPAGENVSLVYRGHNLLMIIQSVKKGNISSYGLQMVVYQGKGYSPHMSTTTTILKAIEENVSPKVLAVVDL